MNQRKDQNPDHPAQGLKELEAWDDLIDAVLINPLRQCQCPFCFQETVGFSWSLFHRLPRTASFDIWCNHCGRRAHLAKFLPKEALDQFPAAAGQKKKPWENDVKGLPVT